VSDWGITDGATAAAFLKSRARQLRQQNRGLLRQKLRVQGRRSRFGICAPRRCASVCDPGRVAAARLITSIGHHPNYWLSGRSPQKLPCALLQPFRRALAKGGGTARMVHTVRRLSQNASSSPRRMSAGSGRPTASHARQGDHAEDDIRPARQERVGAHSAADVVPRWEAAAQNKCRVNGSCYFGRGSVCMSA